MKMCRCFVFFNVSYCTKPLIKCIAPDAAHEQEQETTMQNKTKQNQHK